MGSFWDDISGETAAEASRAAAGDTYGKQHTAIEGLIGYGNEYAGKYADMSRGYAPYAAGGANTYGAASDSLMKLLSNPESVRGLPGYQFAESEGVKALDRSASARHMSASGRSSKDLLRFGTGLADQTYGTQLARLMGLQQQGYNQGTGATGAMNSTVGQGLQGQLGTRQSAYGGDMTAAGTIGQGDIAAANAQAAGSQNLLNTGLKIGGMMMGGMGGGGLGALMGGMGGGGMGGSIPIGGTRIAGPGDPGFRGWS